jgi:hypothetical protein
MGRPQTVDETTTGNSAHRSAKSKLYRQMYLL